MGRALAPRLLTAPGRTVAFVANLAQPKLAVSDLVAQRQGAAIVLPGPPGVGVVVPLQVVIAGGYGLCH